MTFTKEEAQALLQEVKDNHARLETCVRHDFGTPQSSQRKLTCQNCGGWADIIAVIWYQRGLVHGAAKGEEK